MECLFAECTGLKMGGVPASLAGAAFTGARIGLADMERVAVVVAFNDVAEDMAITFQEHDAASAGNSKTIVPTKPVFVKLDAETSFTEEAFAAADGNGASGVVVYEFIAEELDRANDYTHISANIASVTGAKVISVTYVSHAMKRKPAHTVVL